MAGNEKNKCLKCGWIWEYEDDYCPNCGDETFIDWHDRTCDCEECQISEIDP